MFGKISIIGAGSVGSKTLYSILRTFPIRQKLKITLYNRSLDKAIGVSQDVVGALDTGYLEGKLSRYSQLNNISINPTTDEKDISDSDVVIFAAGISAAFLNSKTREAALPVAHKMVEHFGGAIKEYAPKSTVFMVTNPVDITTKLMADKTGFATGRVVGSGAELDARRFRRFFRYELEKQGFDDIKNILAAVVGGHSGNNMMVVHDSVRIVGSFSEKRLDDFTKKEDQEKIQAAYHFAEKRMQTAEFDIIDLSNEGASFEPAIQLALMTRSYMIGGANPTKITGSLSLDKDNKYYDVQDSVLSVPLTITKGSITIDPERFRLSGEEIAKLRNISQEHSKLIGDLRDIPPSFAEKAEAGFKELVDIMGGFKRAARNPSTVATPRNTAQNALYKKTNLDHVIKK